MKAGISLQGLTKPLSRKVAPSYLRVARNRLAIHLPAGAFTDPDENETLEISVGITPVAPVWLNFDSFAGAFSGTPSLVGNYPVAVVATDSAGLTITNSLTINVMVVAPSNHSLALGLQTFGANRVNVISLSGSAGAAYKLQRTPSLTSPVIWTDVGGPGGYLGRNRFRG